jgi:ABC-2 type transport system permease protein
VNGALITLGRELGAYLRSPVGYIIAFLLYVLRGYEVDRLLRNAAVFGIDREVLATAYLLQNSSLVMLILVPAVLTMRCFAEEKRTGSLEVLLTAPVRDGAVVAGKWGAAFGFFALLWAPAFVLLAVLQGSSYVGANLTWGPILSGMFGILLVGGLLLAVGCFTSSLTDNQLLASLSAMLFAWVILLGPSQFRAVAEPTLVSEDATWLESAWRWIDASVLRPVLDEINVAEHLQGWFFRGVISSSHVVFYLSGTAVFLYLTTRVLESRRWR